MEVLIYFAVVFVAVIGFIGYMSFLNDRDNENYRSLGRLVLTELGLNGWNDIPFIDVKLDIKNPQAFEEIDASFILEKEESLERVRQVISMYEELTNRFNNYLMNNQYRVNQQYRNVYEKVAAQIVNVINNAAAYRISVNHIAFGYTIETKQIVLTRENIKYRDFEGRVLNDIGLTKWREISFVDANVIVKSHQALEKYDEVKFFKENEGALESAIRTVSIYDELTNRLRVYLKSEPYRKYPEYKPGYERIKAQIEDLMKCANAYRVTVDYITSAGNRLGTKQIELTKEDIDKYQNDPSLLMSKSEYNKFIKEKKKEELEEKHHKYYEKVNRLVDYVTAKKDMFIIKGSKEKIDALMGKLYNGTVNTIKKIKYIDSEEWQVIGSFIDGIDNEIKDILEKNARILDYYNSADFKKLKDTCDSMMSSQREFNEYIDEKVNSISKLFGTRITRTETENEDVYEYIRPYKKTITPFTAEVSAAVFASAENNPLEYVIKCFYPNKANYPEQILKLQLLVEELETLQEAKEIIDSYKVEYKQYLTDVPSYVLEEDETGFYSRLGFANINEETLTVEYRFSYTSGGGMARRSFAVPMTEETIIELINALEDKLTATAFSKEQRALMTKKLREQIKIRDNYTCCICNNSTHKEPNLLLEIDHIIPVAKGGLTKEDNLQTLCWKCNRSKSDKLLSY